MEQHLRRWIVDRLRDFGRVRQLTMYSRGSKPICNLEAGMKTVTEFSVEIPSTKRYFQRHTHKQSR